jgi:ribosomal-protein-alanine N-acetyltransferase
MQVVNAGLREMRVSDLDAVMDIERRAYEFAWSRGNFVDSLAAGYVAQVLCDEQGAVQGYFVAMAGVDEMHLLNISVEPRLQRRGLGLQLLDGVLLSATLHGAALLWLEVRPSNLRALRLYERYGLHAVARRRAYYPAMVDGRAGREDAIVMSSPVETLRRCRGMD